jgi:MFS family permease
MTGSERPYAPPPILRALRHRNYVLFFTGQWVSLIGTWMQGMAQSWLVYRLTGSAAWLGMIGFAGQIPVLLLAPAGGSFADARDRRQTIVVTQAAAMVLAFVLAGLTLSGFVQVWHLFVLAAALGVVNAFDVPARQAFLVEMVGREDLMNAIALNSSMFNGARIVGPAVAGILVGAIGEGWCFFLNGLSFVAVIAGLLAMRGTGAKAPRPLEESAGQRIREGFAFVVQTGPIRAILLLLGLVSLAGMPYSVLMPIFASSILHGGPRAMGLLMGASGVGAIAGALALASRQGVRGLGRWVAWATAGFGLSLIAFSRSRSFWLSAALLVPVGFTVIVQTAASNTLVQAMVPDRLRGRVMAVYTMMFLGMAPFGSLLAGTLAARFGAPAAVAVGGSACVVAAGAFALRLPALRVQGRELLLAQEAAAGKSAG